MDEQSENTTPETDETLVEAVTDENIDAAETGEPDAEMSADHDLTDGDDLTDGADLTDGVDEPRSDSTDLTAEDGEPSRRLGRLRRPLWVGIAAGVAGLALGLGGAALVGGHVGHGGRHDHHSDIADGFGGGHHDGGADHVDIDGDGN